MQDVGSLPIEDRAAELVDYLDLQGYVLTYSASLYLCRLAPSWGSSGLARLGSSFAAIGIPLTAEQALEAFAIATNQPCEPDPQAEADWEILLTHPERRPEARRLHGAFYEARKTFVSLIERGIAGLRPFPWGMIRPTTAGVTVLFNHRETSPAARLRCLTRPLPSRLPSEHRQHIAEALRRTFEDKHQGWLDGVAALSARASTAELLVPGLARQGAAAPLVESSVFAMLELSADSWQPASRDVPAGLRLYVQHDAGQTLLNPEQLEALAERYRHFLDARPTLGFGGLLSPSSKLP